MGKKETLKEPQYNPVSDRGGLSKRENAKFYENMMLNDPSFINSTEEEKVERLNRYFNKYIAPIEAEEGKDVLQIEMARNDYMAEKFPPPVTEADPFPIPSFEDFMPEAPAPPMDWPKGQKVKTEAQREEEAAATVEDPEKIAEELSTEEIMSMLMPDGEPQGLLATPKGDNGKPATGSYIGDMGQKFLAGIAKLPNWSKKGSKFAEKILDSYGGFFAWELKKLGIDPAKADKAGEYASKVGFGHFTPVQALRASNEVKELIDTKTNYYKSWEEEEKALLERSARYDKAITELWESGDKMQAVGAAVLEGAESLPLSIMAAFGGGAGLATIGVMTGGEKYERLLEEGVDDQTALINGAFTGTFEAVSELGTAGLGYLIKASIKKVGKEATEELVKTGLRAWMKKTYMKVGLWTAPVQEGAEEYFNAVAENLTDKYTGVRPDVEINEGASDAFWAGVAGGGYFTTGGAVIKAVGGVKAAKQKAEVKKQVKEAAQEAQEGIKRKEEWAGGLKLDPEYQEKVKQQRKELDDTLIKQEQLRNNLPQTPDINIEDATDETLDAIERGEPVINERLKAASDNLYSEYKALAEMMDKPDRKYTTDQINDMMEVLEFEITLLNDRINEQAKTGEFKTEPVKLTDKVEVSQITEGVEGKGDEGIQPETRPVEEPAEPAEPEPVEEAPPTEEPAEEPVEEPAVEAIGDFGDPAKILTDNLKEANTRFASREKAVTQEIQDILKEKPAIEQKLSEYKGFPTLEQKKEKKVLQAQLAKMEREADAVFAKWREDIAQFAEQIRPTIEGTIRELEPNITDEDFEKAMFYVWDDITRLREDEIDPDINIEDHIVKVLAEEIYPERVTPEETPPVKERKPRPERIDISPFMDKPQLKERVDVADRAIKAIDKMEAEGLTGVVKNDEDNFASMKSMGLFGKGRNKIESPEDYDILRQEAMELKVQAEELMVARDQMEPVKEGMIRYGGKDYASELELAKELAKYPLGALPQPDLDAAVYRAMELAEKIQKGETVEEEITKPAPPTPEPVADKERLHDTLVDRVAAYNKIPKSHNVIRQKKYGWILKAAGDLGYSINQVKDDLVITDKDGNKIRYITRKTPQEEINEHPTLNEYEDKEFVDFVQKIINHPTFLMNYDAPLDAKGITQAVKNIQEGKKTVAANNLLDALEGSFAEGSMEFKKTATTDAVSAPISDIIDLIEDEALRKFHDEFGELGPDNAEQAVKAGLMTEEQKDKYLKSIEDEIRQAEEAAAATEPGEERTDTGKDQGPIPGENAKERQRVIQEIEDKINEKRNQLQEVQKKKQKKFAELNQRKGLFGDTKTDPNAPGMFEETFEPTDENIQKALEPFNAEISAIIKDIVYLDKSKYTAGKEAAGQVEIPEEEPYDNAEYKEALGKIITTYESIGDMDTAAQLRNQLDKEPKGSWKGFIDEKRKESEFAKRKDDILTGKVKFDPVAESEPYTEERLFQSAEGQIKRGQPITPFLLQATTKEDRTRLIDAINKNRNTLSGLGFYRTEMIKSPYLADLFIPTEVIDAFFNVGIHQMDLENNKPEATREKLENALKQFRTQLNQVESLNQRAKKRAFIWEIKNNLWNGVKMDDFRALTKIAEKWGIVLKTTIREAAEVAMVEVSRSIATDGTLTSEDKFSKIQELYSTFPTLSYRTNEIKDKQQYSTPPPLAFLMGEYTNAREVDNVMDTSAGNGALLISANKKGVRANEIDLGRLQNLKDQGYRVYNVDSTHGIQDQLDVNSVDAVHLNPPFGGPKEEVDGYPLHGEYVPVAYGLKSMSDTGKAAIITGGHIEFKPNGQMIGKDLTFFNWLNKHYYVEDVIQISGDLYSTMGASYPIKLILVNGRKSNPGGAAPLQSEMFNPVEEWADVQDRVNIIKTLANESNSLQRKVDANRGTDSLVGGRTTDPNPATERAGADQNVQGETGAPFEYGTAENERIAYGDTSRPDPGAGRTRASQTDTRNSTIPKPTGITDKTGRRGEIGRFGEVQPSRGLLNISPDIIRKPDNDTKRELGLSDITSDDVTPYRPLSQMGSGEFIIPASIAAEVQEALKQLSDEIGNVDEYVRGKLKYNSMDEVKGAFFAEQVDGIAQAIYNIEGGNAMVIGHQTGTGKGRIAAGIIRYAIENGKLPVFITKGADLFTDIYRDLVNIGNPEYKPFVMNKQFASSGQKTRIFDKDGNVKWEVDLAENNRIIGTPGSPGTKRLPEGTKMIMTTYSQFNTEDRDAEKRAFLNQLTRENDVIFIMDESHEASGQSNTGDYFKDWLMSTQGGVFLSATYAKRPDNMPLYAMKTVLREANMTLEELVDGILAGGPALQEIITHQLAESGQFTKIGFKMDAEINYTVLGDTDPSQKTYDPELGKKMVQQYDNITGVLREIINFQKDYVDPVLKGMDDEIKAEGKQVGQRRGTSQAGISNSPYFSRIWNIVDQLLISMKVIPSLPLIIEDLKAGRKPVIALKSTMESMFDDMVDEGELVKGETISLDFSHVLKRGMETVMKYTEKDEMGNDEKKNLGPEDLTQAGRSRYYDLMEQIQKMTTGIPVSPIDILRKGIQNAGFEVVEVTGRSTMFDLNDNMDKGTYSTNDRGDKIKAVAKFNNETGVAAIVNKAGSTGISMHSSPDFKDVSQRTMWTLQNDLDINVVVQLFGRVYRADQLNKPIYNLVTSALPSEMRMFLMNAKKLKSLDANVSGNQKQSKSLVNVTDFFNKYGDNVVYEYLKDNPGVNILIQDPLNIGAKDVNKQDAAHRVTGRLQILPSTMQEEFYKDVTERYENEIEYRNSTGTNDLMVTNEELEAEFVESKTDIEGNGGFSYFGDDTMLNQAEVNVTRKPMTQAELLEQLDKVPENHVEEMRRDMHLGVDNHTSEQVRQAQESAKESRDMWRQRIQNKEGLTPEEKEREFEIKKKEIDDREENRIDTIRSLAQLNKSRFQNYFNFFYPGKGLEIPFTDDEQLDLVRMNKGVFISFDVNMNKPNPWIPSNVMLKFATTDSRRMIRIPVSKSTHLDAIKGNSYHISESESEQIIENWDSTKKGRKRETRFIVTGNILQGINKFKKGRLIKFSMKDGSMEKGVLMPENWVNPTDNIARIPINKADKIIKALPPWGFVEDFSGNIIIKKLSYGDPQIYELQVPSSTKKGQQYYSNDDLKSLVFDGLFEQKNQRMVAKFSEGSLQRILNLLNERFKVVLEVDSKQVQKGHDQTESTQMMSEYGAPAPSTPKDRGGLPNPYNATQGLIYTPTKGRVAPDPVPLSEGQIPKSLWEIQNDVSKAIGKKIQYTRRPSTRRAAGSYDPTIGKLGIKRFGDEDVAAHEIGHYLDDKYGLLGPKAHPIYNDLKEELSRLWDFGSKPPRNHPNPMRYKMAEGMAELIRAWLVNPAEAIRRYPTSYNWFSSQIKPHTEVWDGLVQFGKDIRSLYGASAGDQLLTNLRMDPTQAKTGIAWRRENKEGQFQVTIFDKMGRRIWYFLDPLVEAFKYAMKQQGITDIHDPNQLSPLQNFEIVARNHLGLDVKLMNLMEKGLINFDGERIYDQKTGKRLSFNLLFESLKATTEAEYEDNILLAMKYGIAQRSVELPKKYQARLLRLDLETTVDRLPPLNILGKHPHIIEMFSGKINDILTRMDEGKLDPEDVWIDPDGKDGRYDFTDIVIHGAAQSGQRDYDIAVAAVKEFEQLKIADPELAASIEEFWRVYRLMGKEWSNYAYQAGLISLETRNQIQNENLDYVAMNRLQAIEPKDMVEGKDLEFGEQRTPTGRGLQPKNVVFPFKGSDRPIDNPVSSLIKSWMTLVDVGDMNYAVQTFAEPFKRSAVGRDMHEGPVVKHGEIAWVSEKRIPGGYSIAFYEKGQQMYLNFGDKYLYETWRDLLPVSDSLGMRIASFAPQLLRQAITHSVRFVTRNMMRDFGQWLVVGEAKRYSRPWYLLPNKEADDAFERYGGGQFGFVPTRKITGSQRRESQLPQHRYMLKAKKHGNPATTYTMVGKGFKFAQKQFNLSERPTRRLQYMSAYQEGIKKYNLTHAEAATRAAFISRDLMDFAAAGTVAREANKVLIFTSAAVRGLEKIARTAKKNPKRFLAHIAAFSILPSLMNSLFMLSGFVDDEDREEYLSHPNYLRDGFYRLPNPFGYGWIIIPKPFELGRIGSIAQRGMDKVLLGDEYAFSDGFWWSFITAMNPYSIGGITSGYGGAIGTLTNWDMFRQKNIIPPSERNIAITSRETENASKFSRLLQEGSDAITWRQEENPFIDARMLDHFLFTQFSTYAEYPIGLFEYAPILGEANKRVAMDADVLGIWKDPQVYGSKHVQYLLTFYQEFPHTHREGHYIAFNKALSSFYDPGVQADPKLMEEQGRIVRETALSIRKDLEEGIDPTTGKPRDFHKEAATYKAIKNAKTGR